MRAPFLVSFVAGMSTLLGGIVIFIKNISKDKMISSSLYFASGVMITVSVLDLFPSGMVLLSSNFGFIKGLFLSTIFMIIGIIVTNSIHKITSKKNTNALYNVGILSLMAIILHNIPEGIVTFLTTADNAKLGITLAFAIALHNIPEGISIAIPIYYGTKSKLRALSYSFIAGISELLGAIISFLFLTECNIKNILGFLYPIIAGIMIFLSIEILIPNAKKYELMNYSRLFLFGVGFMMLVHFLT